MTIALSIILTKVLTVLFYWTLLGIALLPLWAGFAGINKLRYEG